MLLGSFGCGRDVLLIEEGDEYCPCEQAILKWLYHYEGDWSAYAMSHGLKHTNVVGCGYSEPTIRKYAERLVKKGLIERMVMSRAEGGWYQGRVTYRVNPLVRVGVGSVVDGLERSGLL